jgi:chemotaxis protein MotA
MGTTLGMIALLNGLGSAEAFKNLGPAMAVGLVATFYGIAIANLILVPMSENLSKLNKEDEIVRDIVIQGIKLLRNRSHPIVVEEYLKSFLLPNERRSLAKVGK